MKKYVIFSILFMNAFLALGQQITIQPYLQDAKPDEITILWETDSLEASVVEWGPTDSLGFLNTGIAYVSEGERRIHEVTLYGLERYSEYFYRVITSNAVSPIYKFKTPPFASDGHSFRMLAMSDMQRDGSKPDKFREIVEEGAIAYLEDEYGTEITENLALVLIPGDLVENGNNFSQWHQHFFNPAEKLLSKIPVYPVLGNHENNSAYYFAYFKLPENGSAGFEEHWWYKDYGNVRIIGLNSNGGFAGQDQLDWLSSVLDNTCTADSIDFVFAQLHHPFKSELWTPGESNFTGTVIEILENFTTSCSKPSIHFFGHTHGYSRGQSRDHKHLWINVATAGGAIDNWGEFPNFDYDEFSVSQDEYGFVLVEVTDAANPSITIKRIGRGDQDSIQNNVLRDSFTIRKLPAEVNQPEAISGSGPFHPECVVLTASPFSAPDATALHGQSHWQVTTLENGFNEPVYEAWRNFENWYGEDDTQAEDDLTDEQISGLDPYTTYYWRVRYRDRELNWSDWSRAESFSTSNSIALGNLLQNPGAEGDLQDWEIILGIVESQFAGNCDGTNPYEGDYYFAVGGLCDHSPVGILTQDVDISNVSDSIDAGAFKAHFGGYISNYSGSDRPEIKLLFLSEFGDTLSQSNILTTLSNNWVLLEEWSDIPMGTSTIRFELKGTRNAGVDNDSYFDALFLQVGRRVDCNDLITSINPALPYIPNLTIQPNPITNWARIKIPEGLGNVSLYLVDQTGKKHPVAYEQNPGEVILYRKNLTAGNYLLWVKTGNRIVGKGKLVVVE